MKPILLSLFFLLGFASTHPASAVSNSNVSAIGIVESTGGQMTVKDFLDINIKDYRTPEGKKLNWSRRLLFNITQKSLARQVQLGKIVGTMPISDVAKRGGGGRNTYGLLSLIFSVGGLFIPILGLGFIIAALVLGIIGIRRDYNPTMAIIGTVLSGLFLLLFLIVLVIGIGILLGWG